MSKTEKKHNKFVFSKLSSDWNNLSEKITNAINNKIDCEFKNNISNETGENFKKGVSDYILTFYNKIPDLIRQLYFSKSHIDENSILKVTFTEDDLKTLISLSEKLNNKEITNYYEFAKLTSLTMNYFDSISYPLIKDYIINFVKKYESKLDSFFFFNY